MLSDLCFPLQVGEGCGSPIYHVRSPLHDSLHASSSLSSSSVFTRTIEFSFDASTVQRSLEQEELSSSPLIRYRPLTNTLSQEGLGSTPTSSSPRSCPSSDSSPIYARRERHSEGNSWLNTLGVRECWKQYLAMTELWKANSDIAPLRSIWCKGYLGFWV